MQRSSEVEDFVRRMLDRWQSGDAASVEQWLASDVTVIGTDPDEWWSGREKVAQSFRQQLEATGGFPLEAGDPEGYASGDVGWFATRFSFTFPGMPEIPTRLTGVVVREDGDWRAAQLHVSIGVSNEEVAGEEIAAQVQA